MLTNLHGRVLVQMPQTHNLPIETGPEVSMTETFTHLCAVKMTATVLLTVQLTIHPMKRGGSPTHLAAASSHATMHVIATMTGTGITIMQAMTVLTGPPQGLQDILLMTYPWIGRAQSIGSLMNPTLVVLIPVIVMPHLLEMTASRRGLRRDDYPVYDSYDKSSRDYGDTSRRSSGTAERSRYPESFSGRSNSVVLRDPHTQNQGPGRSSTLSTLSTSCRPARRTPFAPPKAEDLFSFPEKLWELSSTGIYASTDSQVFIVAFSLFVSMLYAMSRSQQLFPLHVSSYRTQFPFSPPEITITPL